MAKVDEYKMFAGCTIGNRIPFIEVSSRKVFDKLGIKTSDAAFSCCPDPVGFHAIDHTSWLAMGARNLVLAEEIENPYKQKYNDIKGQFEQLQEDYNELKSAVEKLMSKDEI